MSSAPSTLHNALLRTPILHILRAAGFHSLRPSVLDTLADLAARYLALLAESTAHHLAADSSHTNNPDEGPTLTHVRLALQDGGALVPSSTPAEEAWREALRRPLECYPDRNGVRQKEQARRDAEDTADVRAFIEWVKGPANAEIMRVAGLQSQQHPGQQQVAEGLGPVGEMGIEGARREDYLTVLKKKHSKTGEESRYQGTVLGKAADDRPIRIEGGPAETVQDWYRNVRERSRTKSPERELASDSPLSALNEDEAPTDGEAREHGATEA
ncbi:MAG: hypothetical protein M1821_002918 [Bathelium mastoideum]|nr:MAG: hypothetical protein M1821_002918 [Bathelium mastoideum]